ncbi:hypothetical protein [Pseudacidovorax intermedius]|uniref:hypothetical protein n=1 Tax=Pseudacidovorax intermedius TaxID=433924 RepID=UPI001B136862|nr:hypothetical protein [Pseudacidovorax intermedius]MBO9642579.1 hypothetical protein [Pseudacidovorax sp.]
MTGPRAQRVILLQSEAPEKPAHGAPCNGCGVCCAHAPCPLGMVASRRTHGACAALVWQAGAQVYRCGLIVQPERWLPRPLRRAAPWLARLARRYIAAGQGCDAHLDTEKA